MESIHLENRRLAAPDSGEMLATVHYDVGVPRRDRVERKGQNALFQNYPNPFNPETWIPCELAENAAVTIHIYNVRGHRIRSLELGFRSAGLYTTRADAAYWDGRSQSGEPVSSGVYYVTILFMRGISPTHARCWW